MWELNSKESWVLKNWCFWTVVLEKALESPLDCKEIKPVNPKGNQSWIFIGRTDAEMEAPILWPPDARNWLTGKDPDAGKDWRREEKGTTEHEMVGWHHWLDGHELEQALGVGDGQGSLACCIHRVAKSRTWLSDWTELRGLESLKQELSRVSGAGFSRQAKKAEPCCNSGCGLWDLFALLPWSWADLVKECDPWLPGASVLNLMGGCGVLGKLLAYEREWGIREPGAKSRRATGRDRIQKPSSTDRVGGWRWGGACPGFHS